MNHFLELVVTALGAYAVTAVICISHIGLPLRRAFRSLAAQTESSMLVRWAVSSAPDQVPENRLPILDDQPDPALSILRIDGFDPISCRLCVGFWISLFLCLFAAHFSLLDVLAVYGLSYAIVTWEKY